MIGLYISIVVSLTASCAGQETALSIDDQQTKDDQVIDTVNQYVYKYYLKNGLRDGKFLSYYFKDGKSQGKAVEAQYVNGKLTGSMSHFNGNGDLVTKYSNIEIIEENENYSTYKCFASSYVGGSLVEEGWFVAFGEEDMMPIFDGDISSNLKKLDSISSGKK